MKGYVIMKLTDSLKILFGATLLITTLFLPTTAFTDEAELVSVRRIWLNTRVNELTDLTRFNDQWYCTFREGEWHGTYDGAIRVIESSDGEEWESIGRIESPLEGGDCRDPHLSITPDNELMVNYAVRRPPYGQDTVYSEYLSYASFLHEENGWSDPERIIQSDNRWLWSIVWQNDLAYSAGYSTGRSGVNGLVLYNSDDGRDFNGVVDTLLTEGILSEASLVFDSEDNMYALVRSSGIPDAPENWDSYVGYSSAPDYTNWSWHHNENHVGGPKIMFLPDGRLIGAGRLYNPHRTSLFWIDPAEGTYDEFLELPSGRGSGYPGMHLYEDTLWVSYYSGHEFDRDTMAVYLAKVVLPNLEVEKETKLRIPTEVTLISPFPNPFNSTVTIPFNLQTRANAKLQLFDSNGRLVTTLLDNLTNGGHYQVQWNAGNLPTGHYFISLKASDNVAMQKVTLLK